MRIIALFALCAMLAACGVKRPLRLEGTKRGEKHTVAQPVSMVPTTRAVSDQDRMMDSMTGNVRTP